MPPWRWTLTAAIVILAGLAKPHYVSCILAATLTCAVLRAANGHAVPWKPLGLGVAFPAVLVVIWAASGNVALAEGGSATFAPLAVLGNYVPVDASSITQRIASDIAFPLTVTAIWPVTVIRFPPMAVAWLAYLVGVGQALLLAETGSRMFDGNFIWSGQLATFGLVTAAAVFLGHVHSEGRASWRVVLPWAILLLHAAYGVGWAWIRFQNA
jgi:hypothetical protein